MSSNKSLWDGLKALLTLTPVWVDKGQGRWVLRRRLHPVTRFALILCTLIALISWGVEHWNRSGADTEIQPRELIASKPAPALEPSAKLKPVPAEPSLNAGSKKLQVPLRPSGSEGQEVVKLEVSKPELTLERQKPVKPAEPKPKSALEKQKPVKPAEPKPKPALEKQKLAKPAEPKPKPPLRAGNTKSALGPKEYWVRIRKGEYRLYLYRGEKLVRSYSVAVGRNGGNKQAVGDHRTPVGTFRVQSIENSSQWKHDFRDGRGLIDGAYGPWFIRLATGWKGIGIHGTHDPDSRGTMATEGCIRMSNEEVEELRKVARVNMRVVIEE
ncbi:MAG: L,D-transpeptidase family protein [Fretibacterium sp.]|nr:L,D-transpeptidase family protein [Fretibacterium sp.]